MLLLSRIVRLSELTWQIGRSTCLRLWRLIQVVIRMSHIYQTNVVVAAVASRVCTRKIVVWHFVVELLKSNVVRWQNNFITTRRIGMVGRVRNGICFVVVYQFQVVEVDLLLWLLALRVCMAIENTLMTSVVRSGRHRAAHVGRVTFRA